MSQDNGAKKTFLQERKEEDEMFQRATRHACWAALRQLREDKLKIWSEFLAQDTGEKIPDEQQFNAIWEEEIERTRRMLEALYNNFQLTSGTNV